MNITIQKCLLTKALQIALGALLLAPIQSQAFLITNESGVERWFNSKYNNQIFGVMYGTIGNGQSAACDPALTDCQDHTIVTTTTKDPNCTAWAILPKHTDNASYRVTLKPFNFDFDTTETHNLQDYLFNNVHTSHAYKYFYTAPLYCSLGGPVALACLQPANNCVNGLNSL